jgi:hypothetical protein
MLLACERSRSIWALRAAVSSPRCAIAAAASASASAFSWKILASISLLRASVAWSFAIKSLFAARVRLLVLLVNWLITEPSPGRFVVGRFKILYWKPD